MIINLIAIQKGVATNRAVPVACRHPHVHIHSGREVRQDNLLQQRVLQEECVKVLVRQVNALCVLQVRQ